MKHGRISLRALCIKRTRPYSCAIGACGRQIIPVTSMFWVIEQEKKVLSKAHLQEAMGKLEPPIRFRLADRTEVLIQYVVDSMRMRELAPSSLGQVSKGSRALTGSEEDDDVDEQEQKKTKVEPKKVVALAVLGTTVEDVSEDPSKASMTAFPTGLPHPASDEETRAFGSQHLACVLSAAVASLKDMKERVAYVKMTSDVFKAGVPLSCKSDGAYSKMQIAESIAKCRPGGVTTAHELLTWLMVSAAK